MTSSIRIMTYDLRIMIYDLRIMIYDIMISELVNLDPDVYKSGI